MILKTKRLLLRPLELSDLYTRYKYSGCIDTAKYMVYLPEHSINETREFLKYVSEEWAKEFPDFYEFAIVKAGVHIGEISIYPDREKEEAELGWILNKEYWNNGYVTEAAFELIKFAERDLNIHKFIACCDTRNKASAKVMKKLGMIKKSEEVRFYRDERGIASQYLYEKF